LANSIPSFLGSTRARANAETSLHYHTIVMRFPCVPPSRDPSSDPGQKTVPGAGHCGGMHAGSLTLGTRYKGAPARTDCTREHNPLLQLLINNLPVIYRSCFYLPIYSSCVCVLAGGKSPSMTLSLKLAFVVRSPAGGNDVEF
jgi:hypothetical protein